ncbi:MAG: hypothetical protein ACI4E1_13770 [Lachnospira sp.]
MTDKTTRFMISVSFNIFIVVLSIYIVIMLGRTAYSFGFKVFNEQAVDSTYNAREVEVTITDNISVGELANVLYKKGLITDKTVFIIQASLSDYKGKFVGGTYTVSTDMTPTQIMQVLAPADDSK